MNGQNNPPRVKSGPKLRFPLKKSTLTLTKPSRRRSYFHEDDNERGNYFGIEKQPETASGRHGNKHKQRESTPVQTDADVPASLEADNGTHPEDNKFRKNAIKILNWLFENPQISNPPLDSFTDANDEEKAPDAIATLLSMTNWREFGKVNPPELRLVINGNQYTIKGNSDSGDSFYRALAQASMGDESNSYKMREQIYKYVTMEKNLNKYQDQLRTYYRKRGIDRDALYAGTKYIAKLYKSDLLKDKLPGSYFELGVYAEIFKINISLIFKRKDTDLTVVNFSKKGGSANAKTLVFLVWSKPEGSPVWNWLVPVGSFLITDGDYQLEFKRTFVVESCCYNVSALTNINASSNNFSSLEYLGLCCTPRVCTFSVGTQELALPSSNFRYPQDLFSMLSVIFFENIYHAEEIRHEIWEHRTRFSYFISLGSKKKRGSAAALTGLDYVRRKSGDFMDLKIAASVYKFCYALVTMDRQGNLSHLSECRDRGHKHVPKETNGNYIAFFTQVTPRDMFWYKLEIYNDENVDSAAGVMADHHECGVANGAQELGRSSSGRVNEEIQNVEHDMSMAQQARRTFQAMYSATHDDDD